MRLEEMLALAVERQAGLRDQAHRVRLEGEVERRWPTIQRILDELMADRARNWTLGGRAWWTYLAAECRQALGILADAEEVAQHMGAPAPRASLDELHPWVWDAARTFWSPDGYRVAVAQAAAAVSAHVQAKVNRWDVADDALMNEVFGEKSAATDKPRLRLPRWKDDQTQESRQRGARALAQGCYWALRNPATHQVSMWTEQEAVEALCAFSILARLIEECDVQRAE